MRKSLLVTVLLLLSTVSFGSTVPEFFYQPTEKEAAIEGGVGYYDSTDSNANQQETPLKASAAYGLTHKTALRLGTSYSFGDREGLNNFTFNYIGHTELSFLNIHWGIEGSLTADKTGSENFTAAHFFNPYLGVSMGDSLKYGAKLTYKSINTAGDVWGDNYSGALFAEMNTEKYLAGAAAQYHQITGVDDSVEFDLYGRLYFDKFMLLPKVMYIYALDDQFEDSYGVEIAARFLF